MRDISRMTTGDTTFGANQAAEIEQAQQMATSLDNLANASIQKNATIDNLVATNAAFSKAIQDIQCTLATMMTAHTPAPGAPGCANPTDLESTAFIDTAASITLLTPNVPARSTTDSNVQITVLQPSGAK